MDFSSGFKSVKTHMLTDLNINPDAQIGFQSIFYAKHNDNVRFRVQRQSQCNLMATPMELWRTVLDSAVPNTRESPDTTFTNSDGAF